MLIIPVIQLSLIEVFKVIWTEIMETFLDLALYYHITSTGHVLSDWMSIRHYCTAQLKAVWLHMRINMSLGDEETSFFIMKSMYQLFMVSFINDIITSL